MPTLQYHGHQFNLAINVYMSIKIPIVMEISIDGIFYRGDPLAITFTSRSREKLRLHKLQILRVCNARTR